MYELSARRPAYDAFDLAGLVSKIRSVARPPPLPAGFSAEWAAVVAL